MDVKKELALRIEYVNEWLKREMPDQEGYQKTVLEAMEYAILSGGKRIRPILMKETYHLFGGGEEEVIGPFMAAMEMLHTYSLVHDDLPSMDNDDTRRGRETTHIVYGEAMALLAGDALLNYAFETACKALVAIGDKEAGIRALEVFAKKAGVFGMIGGQVVDVETMTKNEEFHSLDVLRFVYETKTAGLFEASMMVGAILAGAKEEEVAVVEKIAKNLGVAFQVKDDVLDVVGTKELLGKPIGSDDKNDKKTYVTLMGLDRARETVKEYSLEAMEMIGNLPYQNEFLTNLVEWLIDREQ